MNRFISGIMLGCLILGIFIMAWNKGYTKASKDLEAKWYEGPEGYCLADKPAHPGECNQ